MVSPAISDLRSAFRAGYGLHKELESALELFHEMPREGVPYNTITYNSILEACVKCGDVASAEASGTHIMRCYTL